MNGGHPGRTEESSALGWKTQHLNLEMKKKKRKHLQYRYTITPYKTFLFIVLSFTQSRLHRVDDMSEAVRVECVGAAAGVKTRVDPKHGIVQRL